MFARSNRFCFALFALNICTLIVVLSMMFWLQPSMQLREDHPDSGQSHRPHVAAMMQTTGGAREADGISRDELRAILREIVHDELAALSQPPAQAGNTDSHRYSVRRQIDASEQEQQMAANASTGVVQQAIAAGSWTRTDTQALLPYLDKLSVEQNRALRESLADAINRQQMRLEHLPPL